MRHLRVGLTNPSDTLLKPLMWQGDVCFGPEQDGRPTLQSPAASPHWTGLPDVDEAGPFAIRAYLAGYGPATRANLRHWLVAGLSAGRRRVDRWLADLLVGDVVEVDVAGQPRLHLREHLDALTGTGPGPDAVTLLPGYDQWVMGPGTDDADIVLAQHRAAVTRGANPVLVAGVVRGTWTVRDSALTVSWFDDPPDVVLEPAAQRLARVLRRDLGITVHRG